MPTARLKKYGLENALSVTPLVDANCGRVFWRGSHYRRMMGRLLRWQGGGFA